MSEAAETAGDRPQPQMFQVEPVFTDPDPYSTWIRTDLAVLDLDPGSVLGMRIWIKEHGS
jgi:hypothetical protein